MKKSEVEGDFLFRFGLIGQKKTYEEAKSYVQSLQSYHKGGLEECNKKLIEWTKDKLKYQEIIEDLCSCENKEGKNSRSMDVIIDKLKRQWKEFRDTKKETIKEFNQIVEVQSIYDLADKAKYLVNVVLFCQKFLKNLCEPSYLFDSFYQKQRERMTSSIKNSTWQLMTSKKNQFTAIRELSFIKTFLKNMWVYNYQTYEKLIQDEQIRNSLLRVKRLVYETKFNSNFKDGYHVNKEQNRRDYENINEPLKQRTEQLELKCQQFQNEAKTLKNEKSTLQIYQNAMVEQIKNLKDKLHLLEGDKNIILDRWNHSQSEANLLNKEKSTLESQLFNERSKVTELHQKNQQLEEKLESLSNQNRNMAEDVEMLKTLLESLRSGVAEQEHQIKQEKETVQEEKIVRYELMLEEQKKTVSALIEEKQVLKNKILHLEAEMLKKTEYFTKSKELLEISYNDQMKKKIDQGSSQSLKEQETLRSTIIELQSKLASQYTSFSSKLHASSISLEQKSIEIRQLKLTLQKSEHQSNSKIDQLTLAIKKFQDERSQLSETIKAFERENKDKEDKIQKMLSLQIELTQIFKGKEQELEKLKLKLDQSELKISSSIQQFESLRQKYRQTLQIVEQLQRKQKSPIGIMQARRFSLFNNDIFDCDLQEKCKLINLIENYTEKPIIKSRLLYKFDPLNPTNIHKYVDGKQNLLCVVKTKKVIIAGFYPRPLEPKTVGDNLNEGGLLISVTNNSSYNLVNKKPNDKKIYRGMTYDQYFINFGNSELRLKIGSQEVVSNFNVNNSYFNARGENVNSFLLEGQNKRESSFELCQYYELIFEEQKRETE